MQDNVGNVITIGNFDGVHLGHRLLIEETKRIANASSTNSLLLTFSPHPALLFKSQRHYLILNPDEKLKLLRAMGLNEVKELDFEEIAEWSPEKFFEDILLPLNPKSFVVGRNFCFGKNRQGNIDTLKALAQPHGIECHIVELKSKSPDTTISSTSIRKFIKMGNIENANKSLGYPFTVTGIVEKGAQIGREFGCRTANVAAPDLVLPPCGAYVSYVYVDGQKYPAITALTKTPSITIQEKRLESHLFNTSANLDLYGRVINIEFLSLIRLEETFQDLEALKQAIDGDVLKARTYHQI